MTRTPSEEIQAAEALGKDGDLATAESRLEALSVAPHNWVVRLNAAQALTSLGLPQTAAKTLRVFLRDYAPRARRAPVRAAMMLGDLGFVDEAACVLTRHCFWSDAVAALVRFGHTHSLRIVATKAPNPWIRREAASALCQRGESRHGLAVLGDLADHRHQPAEDHSDFTLRLAAADMLASFGHDWALRRLADDVSLGLLRVFAATALAEQGDLSSLKALSEDQEGAVRTSAAGALRWLAATARITNASATGQE